VPAIGRAPHIDRWTDYPGLATNLNGVNVNYVITFKNCNGFSIKSTIYKSEGRVTFENIAHATTSLGYFPASWSAGHNVLTPQTLTNANYQVTGQYTTGPDGFSDLVVAHGGSGVPQSKCFVVKCIDSTTYANASYSTYDAQGNARSGTTCDFIPQYHSQTVPLAPTPFTPSINLKWKQWMPTLETLL